MVKIRLTRFGKHKSPFYRIVAVDSRKKRDGEYLELIGTYNPLKSEVKVKREVAFKWLSVGAQPSDTVRAILSKEGIMKEFAESKLKLPKKAVAKKKSKTRKVSKAKHEKKVAKKVSKKTTKKAKAKPKAE